MDWNDEDPSDNDPKKTVGLNSCPPSHASKYIIINNNNGILISYLSEANHNNCYFGLIGYDSCY